MGCRSRLLAAWSSWGSVPGIFDDARAEFASERAELRVLLTPAEFTASRRTTISVHYTDPPTSTQCGNPGPVGVHRRPGTGTRFRSGTFLGLAPLEKLRRAT